VSAINFAAPAKTNLWLRILRRRDDGFHDIETRMVLLDLCDELRIEPLESPSAGVVEFTCSDTTLPVDASNLVLRAIAVFRQTGPVPPLRLHLEKQIPHGAGLGGGSSDAAATLLALNRLLDRNLDAQALSRLAAQIGSDVPFFVWQSPCDCSGRGEIVTPVPSFMHSLSLLLITPPFSIPTSWAYQSWQNSREIDGVDYAPQPFPWGAMVNDLERPVFAKHIVLADLKMWLRSRSEVRAALVSGSGSTMFAVLDHHPPPGNLIDDLRHEFGSDFCLRAVRTLPASRPIPPMPSTGQFSSPPPPTFSSMPGATPTTCSSSAPAG
jgi:4-diphosphocytidyl-2-C-methyl-D-erythritol kinase